MVAYRRWSLTRSGRYERVDCMSRKGWSFGADSQAIKHVNLCCAGVSLEANYKSYTDA